MAATQFDCQYCTTSLLGKKYVSKDDNLYCVSCYDRMFSNFCEVCKEPIESDSKDLCYKGRHWHGGCFKCAKCNHSLVEKPFAAKDERLLCTECYSNECSSKCFHCKKTIMPGSRKMEFKGNCWHETCFVCEHCRQPIGTKPLISKESGNYCVPCFEKEFAHYCNFCRKVITSGGITFHGQPWHKECFLCSGCRKELCEEEFMSKDDYPFCLDCYNHLYAKQCAACGKPITAYELSLAYLCSIIKEAVYPEELQQKINSK
ncbi:PREDICTED: four and a half LIM domains protein 5 [Chrysochloris asiatica]|uniref:Four and a half LIM domains protein 5 n=1 Tax=Chrysochloris asiatica TaxID=185453 RepID=A0A9B0TIC9_CHRAS|nr:PREDICTED: four and a half LIM domains protein 5 [Chrysochloris asiatica]